MKLTVEQSFDIACAGAGIRDRFTAEHQFHPKRKWRFDRADTKRKIAVEFHGGVWSSGRHTRGQGFIDDREKMNEAQAMGWRVIELATVEQALDFPRLYAQLTK